MRALARMGRRALGFGAAIALASALPASAGDTGPDCVATADFSQSHFHAVEGEDVSFVLNAQSIALGDDTRCVMTANFSTRSGTAIAGVDFTPVQNETVMGQTACGGGPVSLIQPVATLPQATGKGTRAFELDLNSITGTIESCIIITSRGAGSTSVPSSVPTPPESRRLGRSLRPAGGLLSATGVITSATQGDQCATSFAFENSNLSVVEGDSGLTPVTVQANVGVDVSGSGGTCEVQVRYRTVDGTGVGGTDYVAVVEGLTPPSSAELGVLSIPIEVDVIGNTDIQPDRTFFLEVQEVLSTLVRPKVGAAGGGGVRGARVRPADHLPLPDRATVTILDDDLPTVSIDDVEVLEGDSGTTPAVFTVRAEPFALAPIQVSFETADGTATVEDNDYQPISGTVVIDPVPPYEATITVLVNGDTRLEEDETFQVILTDVKGATIERRVGIGTILNDEGIPAISIDDVEVLEGDSGLTDAVFTVTVSPLTQDVSVDFATVDQSATVADGDYVPTSGTLSFPFGGATSRTVTVQVRGDTRVEEDETFLVRLSNPVGATLAKADGVGTILNDDGFGVVRIASAESVVRGVQSAPVVVERLQPSGDAARVTVRARAGTAMPGVDFVPAEEVVNWGPDEGGPRTVEIPLLAGAGSVGDRTVIVELLAPEGTELGSPSSAVLVIEDEVGFEVELVPEEDLDRLVVETDATLTVRVLDLNGAPIAGVPVFWVVERREAELTSGSPVLSGADGVARQVVELSPIPGIVEIRASLDELEASGDGRPRAQQERSVLFRLRVRGDLDLDSDADLDPGNLSVGGALDFACIEPEGSFVDFCEYLFGLDRDQGQQVVREASPLEVAAQGRMMSALPQLSFRDVGKRLAALRGSGSRRAMEELAIVFGRDEVRLASLHDTVMRGVAQEARFEESLREAVESLPGGRSGGGSGGQGSDTPAPRMDEPMDEPSRLGVFVSGRIATGDRDTTEREEGFDADVQSLTVGIDYRVRDAIVLGGAIGYLTTDLDLANDGGGLDADGYSLTAFGLYLGEALFLEAILGYGRTDFTLRRHVDLPVPFQGVSRFVARGETQGTQWMANLGAGWQWAFGASSLEAFTRGSYVDTSLDAYRERGGGPFDLAIRKQSLDSLLAEVGLSYGYAASRDWGVLQPVVRMSALHEFGDDSRLVRGTFIQDVHQFEFVVPTEEPDRNFFNVAVGLTATTSRGRSFYVFYDTDLGRDDLEIGTFSLGVRFEF